MLRQVDGDGPDKGESDHGGLWSLPLTLAFEGAFWGFAPWKTDFSMAFLLSITTALCIYGHTYSVMGRFSGESFMEVGLCWLG